MSSSEATQRSARGEGSSKKQPRSKLSWLTWGALIACVCALGLAACGSDDDSSTNADTGSSTSASGASEPSGVVAEAQANVDAMYKGSFTQPPTEGPKAQAGKNVWVISCGDIFLGCSVPTKNMVEAGKALGWNMKLVDSKGDPNAAQGFIRQAMASGADGAMVIAFDCPPLKSALTAAKKADFPVVAAYAADCDDPTFGEDPLYAATVKMKGTDNIKDYMYKNGADKADYIIAKSGGKAVVINPAMTDQLVQVYNDQGFTDEMKKCTECKVIRVEFAALESGPKLQQKLSSALLQNPDANAMVLPFDALMGLGVSSALKQAGKTDMMVVGTHGWTENVNLIRDGGQTATLGETSEPWSGWGAADTLNRLFAGETREELPDEGGGWQLVDKENNLPAKGEGLETGAFAPVDYQTAFKKVWGVE